MTNQENIDKTKWLKDLAQDKQYKAENVLDSESTWPAPIAKCYANLYRLMEEGSVYGTLLQMKDLYECILMMPVLASLIYINAMQKDNLLKDYDLLKNWISTPLSMGNWFALSGRIVKKKGNYRGILPESLVYCIEKTRKLISKKTSQHADIVNWRNEVIGHGAMQFEDSEEYQSEIKDLLRNLKTDYFELNNSGKHLYEDIVFVCNNIPLKGKDIEIANEDAGLSLVIEGEAFDVGAFAELNSFLFSSFYCYKGTVKYLDYDSGRDLISAHSGLNEYLNEYKNLESIDNQDGNFSRGVVSRAEEQLLYDMSKPSFYIPPQGIFDQIIQFIDENDKGIIMLCMERGTGKSAFVNSIDNLYNDPDYSSIENTVIRSYSLSNAVLRGINDFVNAINSLFERAYDPNNDIRFSGLSKPEIQISDDNPAKSLAELLNTYQECYSEERDIDNLMLVLDGIDETTIETNKVLDYLPTSDLLNEGVYIVCTSRFKDEDTASNLGKNSIQKVLNKLDKNDLLIEVRRQHPDNIQILEKYIKNELPTANQEIIDHLITVSDYRMLYLKVHLTLYRNDIRLEMNENIAIEYLHQLSKKYNNRSDKELRKIAAMLCLLGPISIKDYFDYIADDELTFGFIGILHDLSPLLTVRGNDYGREYMLANEAYFDAFAKEYSDEIIALTQKIMHSFSMRFPLEQDDDSEQYYVTDIDYEKKELEWKKEFKEKVFWIHTIEKLLSFTTKYGFQHILLTDDFVKIYLNFVDEFISTAEVSVYQNNINKESLQLEINILLALSEQTELGFQPSVRFPRRLYEVEGYNELLNKIFNTSTTKDRLVEWQYVFFELSYIAGDPEDKKLIQHIYGVNLIDSVVDLLSQSYEFYLPYFIEMTYLDLDDSLMEKIMNLIVWIWLGNSYDFFSNEQAISWIKRIQEKGYNILYPEDKVIQEKLNSCLNEDQNIEYKIKNIFNGIRSTKLSYSIMHYADIDEALNNNENIRCIVIEELKKCFDLANTICEEGILPEGWNTNDDATKLGEDNCIILENCSELLDYLPLVYKDRSSELVKKWIYCINICLRKNDDWYTFSRLRYTMYNLYSKIDYYYRNHIYKRIFNWFQYVVMYSNRCFLEYLGLRSILSEFGGLPLPSYDVIKLILLYHQGGSDSSTKRLCKYISDAISIFNNAVTEIPMIRDGLADLRFTNYYRSIYQYICICRQYGYDDVIEGISIDFHLELTTVKKLISKADKFTDLHRLDIIVNHVLSVIKEIGIQDFMNNAVLLEMMNILNERIPVTDEETSKHLGNLIEQINALQNEIQSHKNVNSQSIEKLFSKFCSINSHIEGIDYIKASSLLNHKDSEIKSVAIKELKKCFDIVDKIFEDGILPDQVWSQEQRQLFLIQMKHSEADDISVESYMQERYQIIINIFPLLKYIDLAYLDNTIAVLEKWIDCLDKCTEKHNDWNSYYILHPIVSSLYASMKNIYKNDIDKQEEYLLRYLNKYNDKDNRRFLGIDNKVDTSGTVLLSDFVMYLINMYANSDKEKEAKQLCREVSLGVTIFENEVMERLQDIDLPIFRGYYYQLRDYISLCRKLGYSDLAENLQIDFKRELSALENVLSGANKISDLYKVEQITDEIFYIFDHFDKDDPLDKKSLQKMREILEAKINSTNLEIAEELQLILDQILYLEKKFDDTKQS